jgi:hypothetical protein
MRFPDAVMKIKSVCHKMAQRHGIVSRAFEGINLVVPLQKDSFVAVSRQVLKISSADAEVLFPYLPSGPGGTVQLADLLDVLTTAEEQHHRFLVPLHKAVASVDDQEQTWQPPLKKKDLTSNHKNSIGHLPSLNFTHLNVAAIRTPPVTPGQDAFRAGHAGAQSARGPAKGASDELQLPALPQSARAGPSMAAGPDTALTQSSDDEAGRIKRVEEWKRQLSGSKQLPKNRALMRNLREAVSGHLEGPVLAAVRDNLLDDGSVPGDMSKKEEEQEERPRQLL